MDHIHLAALMGLASSDPSDLLPMTCLTCSETCANRAASWQHTRSTGHDSFRSVRSGDSKHCDHCRGLGARCACKQQCLRPQGAECVIDMTPSSRDAVGQLTFQRNRNSARSSSASGIRLGGSAAAASAAADLGATAAERRAAAALIHQSASPGAKEQEDTDLDVAVAGSALDDLTTSPQSTRPPPRRLNLRSSSFSGQLRRRPAEPGLERLGTAPRDTLGASVPDQRAAAALRVPVVPPFCAPVSNTLGSSAQSPIAPSIGRAAADSIVPGTAERRAPAKLIHRSAPPGAQEQEDADLAMALSHSLQDGPDTDIEFVLAVAASLQDAPPPIPPRTRSHPTVHTVHAADSDARATLCELRAGPVAFDYIARCTSNFAAERAIGHGAYGTVFWAVDKFQGPDGAGTTLEFAAKKLECADPQDRAALDRMTEAEIQTLTRFTHPHIIRLLGFCRSESATILLYEYEPLGSLDKHLADIDKATRLGWSCRSRIISGLVTAVSYLHLHDPRGPCYHRDVKPGNIVLTPVFSPKLIDCGLSRFLPQDRPAQESKRTLRGTTGVGGVGTPGFMCSRYVSSNAFDEKSEIYAIGVTILQVITAKLVFGPTAEVISLDDLIDEHDAREIAAARDLRPPFDDTVASSVDKLAEMADGCLRKYNSRINLIALLRQAKQAAVTVPLQCEVHALREEVARMASDLRQLRIQGEVAQQLERAAMKTCELCFDNISSSSGGGMTCPSGHFVCAGCAPAMVQTFLERVNESDTLLDEHRARGGHIPCFRNTSAFDPRCAAVLSDSELASTLSDEIFVRYRQSQNEVVENRIWHEHNERFQQELARIQRQQQIDSGGQGDEASAEFMRRQYPNARMCPTCQFGPVINERCADLQAHNGEARSGGRSRISNACGRCGFFTRDWNQWAQWDGVLRTGSRR
mmetsp:Transcript_19781/g.68639  ORF Transcript_19781/g.68639 Transcript_19781/m.68639 type:complete len:922 (-) Transcript_19781:120-2885(-)